ncbi:hypothetical protein O0L34_g15804 [Tuta absoluta]|nr:hypothetical protein O0L34_g15804 [Tuta absoluta]
MRKKHVDTKKNMRKKDVTPKTEKESEEEVRDKFTTVVFTEEEMLKNREEKRSHPNFKKIPFKCDSCVLGFLRKENYDLHLKKKHEESVGPYTCPVCQSRFTSQKQVSRHSSKHYVCYRCKLCKYETLEMWSVLGHCRSKHMEDRVESIHCSYCVFVAKSPEELSAHTTSEHALYCDDCGERFKARHTLRSHVRRIHRVKREFTCSLCSKAFKCRSRLESHTANHNAALAQKLAYCALCDVQYKNIYVYRNHLKTSANHAEQSCKVFKCRSRLESHTANHNAALAQKLAYCALCDVQYKNIYVYRNHLKTSANHAEQSYKCVECSKSFASKVYWKKHYNFYHLHKSQFHCDICDKLFISDWRLKNHRQTQHGLSRSRDHHCSVCGKQFFTQSTLKAHQLTHSEQRSFMCEDCGDTFKQRPALYTHCKLVHQGLKRRKCVSGKQVKVV